MKEIVIGCDNAAVALKNTVCELLREAGVSFEDLGCSGDQDTTAYPIIAGRVCSAIQESGYSKNGILICGTGIGMAISANKFKGIRAAVCHDIYSAERSVLSNNGNVLCLGTRVIGPELAKKIVTQWLSLSFKDGPSTEKLEEIKKIETRTMK